ncbi:MAG: ABC transporter ATP-binding protein [Clostridia bacterium]|nr:ABC transporter ATP-binding protein [Clostridia bacterium]
MKNKQTLGWLRGCMRGHGPAFFFLIFGNVLQAGVLVGYALAARSIVNAAVRGDGHGLLLSLIVLGALVLAQFLLRVASRWVEEKIKAVLENRIRGDLFAAMLQKRFEPLSAFHTGELMNRLFNDVRVVADTLPALLPNAVSLVCRLCLAFVVLTVLDVTFAPVFLGAGLLTLVLAGLLRGRLKGLHRRMQEQDGKVRSFMQEALGNLLPIKAFAAQRYTVAAAQQRQEGWQRARMRQRTVTILANAGLALLFNAGYVYALARCGYCLLHGTMDFGTVTSVLQLVGQVQSPFSALSGLLPQYYAMLASAERIMEIQALPDETQQLYTAQQVRELYDGMQSLNAQKITFSYGRDTVLEEADFTVGKGGFIVLTGRSGIGKSTLLKLFLDVFTLQSGRVFLRLQDGREIPVDARMRRMFAYVPQGNFLFSGTLRENLIFAAHDAAPEQIQRALYAACADEFVAQLPQGLDTVLGENGRGLSEGQVQRIAIARALISGAPILLLDESTSALDAATEQQLLQRLRELSDVTVLLISHKTAATQQCDRVLHIENKKIGEVRP